MYTNVTPWFIPLTKAISDKSRLTSEQNVDSKDLIDIMKL